MRLMTMADDQVLVPRGPDIVSLSYCNIADATGVFLIYSIIRAGAESVFCSAQCSARTVLSVFMCWVLTGVWDDLVRDKAIPALALSSLWCHSYFAGRSQLAMSQLLRHPLRGKVSLGEPELMKSCPQENISKTDGPIRQKNKAGIEERRARKKIW